MTDKMQEAFDAFEDAIRDQCGFQWEEPYASFTVNEQGEAFVFITTTDHDFTVDSNDGPYNPYLPWDVFKSTFIPSEEALPVFIQCLEQLLCEAKQALADHQT